jgi:integrase
MQRIGLQCEPEITDCRPHRLRDTFAVRALLKGIRLEDVSKLLGHRKIAVTERYYAAWIPSRKLRLERLLFESRIQAEGK